MKMPWSRRPKDTALTDALAEHAQTIDHVDRVVAEAKTEVRRISALYVEAERQRQDRRK